MMSSTVHASGHVPTPTLNNNLSISGHGVASFACAGYIPLFDYGCASLLSLSSTPTLHTVPLPAGAYITCHAWLHDLGLLFISVGYTLRVFDTRQPGFPQLDTVQTYFQARTLSAVSTILPTTAPSELPTTAVLLAIGGSNGVQLRLWQTPASSSTHDNGSSTHAAPWIPLEMLPAFLISKVTFSLSGRLLAVVSKAGHLGVWDVLQLLHELLSARAQAQADARKRTKAGTAATIRGAASKAKTRPYAAAASKGKPSSAIPSSSTKSSASPPSMGGGSTPHGAAPAPSPPVREGGARGDVGVPARSPPVAHTVVGTTMITDISLSHDDAHISVCTWDGCCTIFSRWSSSCVPWEELLPVKDSPRPLAGDGFNPHIQGQQQQFWPAVLHVDSTGACTSLLLRRAGEDDSATPPALPVVPPAPLQRQSFAAAEAHLLPGPTLSTWLPGNVLLMSHGQSMISKALYALRISDMGAAAGEGMRNASDSISRGLQMEGGEGTSTGPVTVHVLPVAYLALPIELCGLQATPPLAIAAPSPAAYPQALAIDAEGRALSLRFPLMGSSPDWHSMVPQVGSVPSITAALCRMHEGNLVQS